MVSPASPKKRTLLYKKCEDGIFRLKRDNNDEDKYQYPKEDQENDLINCTYNVVDVDDTEERNNLREVPESATRKGVVPLPGALAGDKRDDQNQNRNAMQSRSIPRAFTSADGLNKISSLHTPSVVLGAILAIILVISSPIITYYAQIISHVVKLSLIWGSLLLGVTWYLGIIKIVNPEDILDHIERIKFFFSTILSAFVQQQRNRSSTRGQSRRPSATDQYVRYAERRPPLPERQSRSQSPVKRKPPPSIPATPGKAIPVQENMSKPKLKRNSLPVYLGDLNVGHKLAPTEVLPHAIQNRTGTSSREMLPPVIENQKQLPQQEHSKHYHTNKGALSSNETIPLRRKNSCMSQKSILGTRAKYDAFLASVPQTEQD